MAVIDASIGNIEWTQGFVKNAIEASKTFVTETTGLVDDMAKDWSGTDYIQYKLQWQKITGAGSNIAVTAELLTKYEELLKSVLKEYRGAVKRARERFAAIRGGVGVDIVLQEFRIDTQKMRGHAQTLNGLIKRIQKVQSKASFLKFGFLAYSLNDFFDQEEKQRMDKVRELVKSGTLEDAAGKLTKLMDALNETADDFDATDRLLQTQEMEFTRYLNTTPYGNDYSVISGEIATLLAALGPELLEFYEQMIAYNLIEVAPDGTVTYKWDAIKDFVAKLSDDDEGAYNALALLYMNLDNEADIQKFLRCFMVKTDDCKSEKSIDGYLEFPESYTKWEFDTRKLLHVQKYSDLYTCFLLEEYNAVQNATRADYPNLSDQEFYNLKKDSLKSLGEQRRELLQKSALLSIVTQYGDFKDKPQSIPFINVLGLSDLTGEAGSEPSITISKNADGSYVFGFNYTEMTTGPGPYGSMSIIINHMAPGSVTVSPAVSGDDAVHEAGNRISAYFSEKYNFDYSKATDEKLLAYLGKKVEAELKTQFTNAVPKILGGGAAFAKSFVKYASIAEDAYGIVYDLEKKQLEYNQNVREADAIITLLDKSDYCEKLKLDKITITTENPAHIRIVYHEGPGTERVVENINAYINYRHINPADYGFEDGRTEITLSDVYQNPDKISNLIYGTSPDNGMRESEKRAVFTTEKFEDALKLTRP